MPESRRDRSGRGVGPGRTASTARLAQQRAEARQRDTAIAAAHVGLGLAKEVVEAQAGLLALVGGGAHHDEIANAVARDEDRLAGVVTELRDLRGLVPQVGDRA